MTAAPLVGRLATRAAVFDLDGTLADTAPDIAAALNTALASIGEPPLGLEQVKRMVGGGARVLVERALAVSGKIGDQAAIERAHQGFVVAYGAEPCRDSALYDGALAEIETLRARGWRIGVCTNKPHALAVALVGALDVAPLIDVILGGNPRHTLKPDPGMLAAVLADLGVDATRAVMIGDSAADVGCARALGVASVVLAHGYGDRPAAELGADVVNPGFHGLADLLDGLVGLRDITL